MFSRIKKYLGLTRRAPVITSREDHALSRALIDQNARKVLYRLNQAGHTAYLVGGGVRDLLLGRKPKDFDVATDAHPHQIKELFRNCFLIGRRFRLAHIKFGDTVIETSTFRRPGTHEPDTPSSDRHAQHKRTNTFGTPEDDARMRDFTINGLFYDIRSFTVIDHVGGHKDLRNGIIRCIGDPRRRFPEDPVRMLRAVRFASRLGFSIEKKTYRAIIKYHDELHSAAPARLIEEIYRFFGFGTAEAAFRLLAETKLLKIILPVLDAHLTAAHGSQPALWKYLQACDELPSDTDVPRESAILSALAYPLFEDRLKQNPDVQHQELARDVLRDMSGTMPVPRRIIDRLARAFDAQRRFENSKGRFSKKRFVLQSAFPDALFIRAMVLHVRGEGDGELEQWRTLRQQWLQQEDHTNTPMPEQAPPHHGEIPAVKRRRRRRRKKPASAAHTPDV